MRESKQEAAAKSKSQQLQDTGEMQLERVEAGGMFSSQPDPLMGISGMGNVPSVSSHAAMLNSSSGAGQSHNQQLVLQLQQQYGNHYVNQVLQMARRGEALQSATSLEQDESMEGEAEAVGEGIGMSEVRQENKTGLPDNLKAGIESLSGISMDNVKVHYNSSKPAQLQALAYTQGTDIYVGSGQEKHLPHEAWHVVQQMQGRVKPTMQMKGIQINNDQGLEREADVMGAKAAVQRSVKSIESNPIDLHHEKRNLDYLSTGTQGDTLNLKAKNQDSSVIQRNPIKERLNNYITTSQNPIVVKLANHILTIINNLESGNWGQAYKDLYSKEVAKDCNHKINLKSAYINTTGLNNVEINEKLESAIGKGMYFAGKLDLPDVALLPNNDISQAITPSDDECLAKKVLPVALEEWIHMFQHQIHGYLSAGTELFATTPAYIKNQQEWNLNEVDIYAIYKDLGWSSVLDAFRPRYKEREVYEQHSHFSEVIERGYIARSRRGYVDDYN
jgi:hypothetical protein